MVQITPSTTIVNTAQINPGVVQGSDIANDTILDANIGAHTTTKITVPTSLVSGTLGSTQFADNTVAVGRLLTGTKGNIFIQGVSGIAKLLGVGANGKVLVADSTNADGVAWGDVPAALTQWFGAGNLVADRASVPIVGASGAYLNLATSVATSFALGCMVPTGASSISSVKLYYAKDATGNFQIALAGTYSAAAADSTIVVDWSDDVTLASGGNNGKLGILTLSSTGYNGLGTLAGGGLLTLSFRRNASIGGDTVAAAMRVYGVLVTFA